VPHLTVPCPSFSKADLCLFNAIPLPAFILNKEELLICALNTTASKVVVETTSSLAGTPFFDLFTDQSTAKTGEEPNATPFWKDLVALAGPNNSLITWELLKSEVVIAGTEYLQVIAIDVSAKNARLQKLIKEKDEYRVYISQSSEGIFRHEFTTPISVFAPLEEILVQLKKASIAECNDVFAQMYGYRHAAEMVGTSSNLLLDDNDPANTNYLKAFVANGFKIVDAESHEKDKQGASVYFLNNLVGIVEKGFLKRIWGTQRNITEQKKTAEKINLLASLVEETADVLTAADLEFKPVSWNKAAEQIFGVTGSEVIGNNLRNFIDLNYKNATMQSVREIIAQKGSWRGEAQFIRPTDGRLVTLLLTFKILHNEGANPIGHVIAATDITERKETELKIKESEKRFRDVADSAPVMIWMSNENDETVYVNKPWTDFTGIGAHFFKEGTWKSLVHPDDAVQAIEQFNESFAQKKPITMVYRLKKASGEYRWVLDTGIPRLLNDGSFLGYIGSVVDINDQKIKEDQLRYQATILDNVLDVVVTSDVDYRVKSWNRVAEQVYGYTSEEAIGKFFKDLVDLEFFGNDHAELKHALQNNKEWKGEILYRAKDGSAKYFVHSISNIYNEKGTQIGLLSVGKDVTDRKNAEENLKQSEHFYRSLIADSLDGILLLDPSGIVTFVSPSVKNILGYEAEEVFGKNCFDYVHPDDFAWALQSFNKEVSQNPDVKFIVVRLLCKNGSWLWCTMRGHNLLSNPYVKSIAIYFHDDTLRKNASDALKASEQRFRTLISDIQIGVILYDSNGKIVLCNKEVLQMHNVTEEQLMHTDIYDIIEETIYEDGQPFPVTERPLYKALAKKETVKDVVMGIRVRGSNKIIWLLINTHPVLNEAGNIVHIISSLQNITERKNLQQKLLTDGINQQKALTQATLDGQEKERLEIGKELHDNIGQQLTTTKLYLDMARSASAGQPDEMLNLAIKSITGIINEVRGISRSLVPHTLGDLGLADSIYDLVETINRTLPLAIELTDVDYVEANTPGNQKLMLFRIVQEQLNNIVKHSGASSVHITISNKKGVLVLQIVDNGKGFDGAKTKKGLGLINIKNRAEIFGGTAQISSTPGQGCTVKITIPSATDTGRKP